MNFDAAKESVDSDGASAATAEVGGVEVGGDGDGDVALDVSVPPSNGDDDDDDDGGDSSSSIAKQPTLIEQATHLWEAHIAMLMGAGASAEFGGLSPHSYFASHFGSSMSVAFIASPVEGLSDNISGVTFNFKMNPEVSVTTLSSLLSTDPNIILDSALLSVLSMWLAATICSY